METMQNIQNWMYSVRDYVYTLKENINVYLLSLSPKQVAMLSIGAVIVLIIFTTVFAIVTDAFRPEVKTKRKKKKHHQNIQIAHGDHTAEHAQAMWDEVNKI